MRNLLVPIDFGDASNLVIEKAGELARELPARIVLLHVDEPRAYASLGDAATLVAAWPLETPKRISKLKARLTSLANPLRASGIEVDSVAIVGLVVDDILTQAQRYRADYIILGSHGRLFGASPLQWKRLRRHFEAAHMPGDCCACKTVS